LEAHPRGRRPFPTPGRSFITTDVVYEPEWRAFEAVGEGIGVLGQGAGERAGRVRRCHLAFGTATIEGFAHRVGDLKNFIKFF